MNKISAANQKLRAIYLLAVFTLNLTDFFNSDNFLNEGFFKILNINLFASHFKIH